MHRQCVVWIFLWFRFNNLLLISNNNACSPGWFCYGNTLQTRDQTGMLLTVLERKWRLCVICSWLWDNLPLVHTFVFRCGKCLSCGLASWNVSLKQGHILFMSCCRYYYISWKWIISPCLSFRFFSFSNSSFSFYICLQLPPSQLESALNKHANLRGPLATYANQANTKTSLPRYNSKRPNLSPSLIRESSRLLFHSAVIIFRLPFVMLQFYWFKKFMISQGKRASWSLG